MEDAKTKAQKYRSKAEEIRMIAERMSSVEARRIFMTLAADYLEMAQTIEQMAAGSEL
jgi:saccharopine dehydrogenase-like NADP-dependent oxidoreductase